MSRIVPAALFDADLSLLVRALDRAKATPPPTWSYCGPAARLEPPPPAIDAAGTGFLGSVRGAVARVMSCLFR